MVNKDNPKKRNLTRFINVRFRSDKFKLLDQIAQSQNIARPELIRKVLLDYIDTFNMDRKKK